MTKENAAQIVSQNPDGQKCLPAENRAAATDEKLVNSSVPEGVLAKL